LNKILFHVTASGFYTALCLASLSLSTDVILLKKAPDWPYFSFLFFTTFLYYNLHKISWFGHYRMFQKNNFKYSWPAQYPGVLMLCLIIGFAGSAALISFGLDNPLKILLGFLAALLSLFYNQKIIGIHLRSLKGLKAFTIGMVAIITGVLIPAADQSYQDISTLFLLLFSLSQLFFISALCIAADIRDVEEDKEDGIKTIPVAAGLPFSKNTIVLLLTIQLTFLFILFNLSYINIAQLEAFVAISLFCILFISELQPKNSYFYFILGIDGFIAGQTLSIFLAIS
jgi:1,4-dihydroxy-2-naphthoate octaprenyltransferase